jgi:hypothetical protein
MPQLTTASVPWDPWLVQPCPPGIWSVAHRPGRPRYPLAVPAAHGTPPPAAAAALHQGPLQRAPRQQWRRVRLQLCQKAATYLQGGRQQFSLAFHAVGVGLGLQ